MFDKQATMKRILLLLMLINSLVLQAEQIIANGSEVYSKPGSIAFRLNGLTIIETGTAKGLYTKIMVKVWVLADRILHDDHLHPNSKLFDSLGRQIGNSYAEIVFERRYCTEEDGRISAELFGVVANNSIDAKTIVEQDLNQLFRNYKKQLIFKDFLAHFVNFEYTDWVGSGDFSSKLYPESHATQLNPGGRVVLIFLKEELAAIIYTRTVKVFYYESQAESKPYKIFYMKKMKDSEKRMLADFYFNRIKKI